MVALVATASVLFVPGVSAAPGASSAPHTYPVQISEHGLPTGTAWFIEITTTTTTTTSTVVLTTTSSSIVVKLPNGTYHIRAGTDNLRWVADPPTGTFHVRGAPLSVGVKFDHRAVFPVTFNEKGLPSGASWKVEVSGANIPDTSASSTAASISIALPNGSFAFRITTTANHYKADPSSGTVHVAGTAISRNIKFEKGSVPLAPLLVGPFTLQSVSNGMIPVREARAA
jgi:hypothetical protein